jgi:hypothetical protein
MNSAEKWPKSREKRMTGVSGRTDRALLEQPKKKPRSRGVGVKHLAEGGSHTWCFQDPDRNW